MPCCAGGISRTQSPTRSASETSRCKGCKATVTRSSTTLTGSSGSPSRPTHLPLPPLPRARPLLRLRPHRRLRLRHRQRRACLGSMGLRATQTKTVRASPTACGAPAPAFARTCRSAVVLWTNVRGGLTLGRLEQVRHKRWWVGRRRRGVGGTGHVCFFEPSLRCFDRQTARSTVCSIQWTCKRLLGGGR